MQATLVDFAKERVVYNFADCTPEELDNRLNLFFSSEGYKLKSSVGEIRTYEKGNRAMRIIFGAFSKYNKQSLTVTPQGGSYAVVLQRESSGMSGGLIGMNQVRKEFARLAEAFRNYFKN